MAKTNKKETQFVFADETESVSNTINLTRMYKVIGDTIKTADVHPNEIEDYAKGGFSKRKPEGYAD
jgi:hypothetical protein